MLVVSKNFPMKMNAKCPHRKGLSRLAVGAQDSATMADQLRQWIDNKTPSTSSSRDYTSELSYQKHMVDESNHRNPFLAFTVASCFPTGTVFYRFHLDRLRCVQELRGNAQKSSVQRDKKKRYAFSIVTSDGGNLKHPKRVNAIYVT